MNFRLASLSSLMFFSTFFGATSAFAVPYIEVGTALANMSNGAAYFGQSAAQSTGTGFLGSASLYYPITSERRFFHVDVGLQNRLLRTSATDGSTLAMASNDLSARVEFASRFYGGAGYAPLTYVSKPGGGGISTLHLNSGTTSYFFETGAIWRIIPEFQIVAAVAREYGLPKTGGQSPAPINEYGLRFRFPINPTENPHGTGVDFDGFRYPFGFMK